MYLQTAAGIAIAALIGIGGGGHLHHLALVQAHGPAKAPAAGVRADIKPEAVYALLREHLQAADPAEMKAHLTEMVKEYAAASGADAAVLEPQVMKAMHQIALGETLDPRSAELVHRMFMHFHGG